MNTPHTNPLLTHSTLPNMAPAFDKISEGDYVPAIEEGLRQARANIAAIKSNTDQPDFDNTILAMMTAGEILDQASGVFYNLLSANATGDMPALADKIGPILSNYGSDIAMDAELFRRVKAVWDSRDTLPLTPEQQSILKDSYDGFVRNGALLNDKDKQTLREIDERLSVLGPQFSENVKNSAAQFELWFDGAEKLAGIPDTALNIAKAMAERKGKMGQYLFTLDYPSYGPLIQYADDRALREKSWRAFNSRAWQDKFDNSPLVLEIVRLRDSRAKLLGYKTHAHYVLEKRMAETPETVMAFLEKFKNAYKPGAMKDLEALQDFARDSGLNDALQPWDVAYYAEKLKERDFKFSSEDLRPYFPLEKVLDGVFAHFTKLFNVRFEKNAAYPVWHKDVKAFDVFNATTNDFVGTFYADFHPRDGKKPGAWMTSFREQGLFNGAVRRPVVAIVCNFTESTKDQPSLLTHDEVLTLLHEMGHAMHGLLSNVTYTAKAGTNVLWDFVELPSQLQENWGYQKETLDMMSGHYQTGEKIPADLIKKLNASKNFMGGWAGLRQTGLGTLDMAWHTADPDSIADVTGFEDAATAETSLFKRLAGPSSTSFSHLFHGGYSAGYYSYKWAEVLDADAFEAFQSNGLYDRKTGDAYMANILAVGGTEHPKVIYARFRGRDADPDALLRREGLLPAGKKS